MSYFIKKNYKENLTEDNNPIAKYQSIIYNQKWQVDVYKYVSTLVNKRHSILEVGCGNGDKLIKHIGKKTKDITGVDQEININYCNTHHSFGNWLAIDLENQQYRIEKQFDIIISVDVIEHLVNPDHLFLFIKKHAHKDSLIILSTPERDLVRGEEHTGPPDNQLHIREWNFHEFEKYIRSHDLEIINHFYVNAYKRTLRQKFHDFRKNINIKNCQVITCKF